MNEHKLRLTEEQMKIEVIESIGKVQKAIFGNVLEAMKACGIVTSRVELGEFSHPFLGGTSGFVPSCKRRIAPLKQLGTNG
jgi:hypothetical protein